jgi:hypothetical protein
MSPIVFALAGRAGSGKSTCARWLVDNYGAVEFSLAEPLKRLAQDVFGFSDEQVFGTQAQKEAVDPRWGISPREALIKLGHAARERVGKNVWLDACLNAVARSGARVAVVSDVRYPNEAAAMHGKGAVVVRLRCPNSVSTVDPNAPSEAGVDEIDPNDVSVELNVGRSEGARALINAFAYHVIPYLPGWAPAPINVTIQKIEVPSEDPDRFVHMLVKKFDKATSKPVAADPKLRGGY